MFVKIVRDKIESKTGKTLSLLASEEVYECDAYSLIDGFSEVPDGLEVPPMKTLVINPHLERHYQLSIGINPKNAQIFVMNDRGKTVDYYLWACEDKKE